MHRTTIMLPRDLRIKSLRVARKRGISLAELIRESLQRLLKEPRRRNADDPLFTDHRVFRGSTPRDLAQNHDKYLYGEDDS